MGGFDSRPPGEPHLCRLSRLSKEYLLSDPSVAPRRTTVLLFQGDDRERMERLLADVQGATAAAASQTARTSDEAAAVVAVESYNAFLPEAEARAVRVVVQALGRREVRSLRAAHMKEAKDGGEDLDMEGFSDALLSHDGTIIEPEFDHPGKRDAFLDSLSDADFDRLFTAAYAVNFLPGVVDPKELNVSDLTLPSDETQS